MPTFYWNDDEKKCLKPDLFSKTAEDTVKQIIAERFIIKDKGKKDINTITQIRKFFNEVITYKNQYLMASDKSKWFEQKLPYIQMLNAKLAYANAREFVGDKCKQFFTKRITEIKDEKFFQVFADFFEAFIAYYKLYDKDFGDAFDEKNPKHDEIKQKLKEKIQKELIDQGYNSYGRR